MAEKSDSERREHASTSGGNAPQNSYVPDPVHAGEQLNGPPNFGITPGRIEQSATDEHGAYAVAGLPPNTPTNPTEEDENYRKRHDLPDAQIRPIQPGNPRAVDDMARDDTHGQTPTT